MGKLIRDGRWLLFGREENDALGVPEENIKRFPSVADKPLAFIEDFDKYARKAVQEARTGKGPQVFVIDGWTEWNVLFEKEHRDKFGTTNKFDRWDAIRDRFIDLVQMFNPRVLNAHVIATARVDERRRGIFDKKKDEWLVQPDPEWMDFRYIPAMQGWAKKFMASYYNLVLYVDSDVDTVKDAGTGRMVTRPVHKVYLVPVADKDGESRFQIKNQWEHVWAQKKLPDFLVNPTYNDIIDLVGATSPLSVLLYGTAGAGKSATAVSSFWDFR